VPPHTRPPGTCAWQHIIRSETEEWIAQHYPDIFSHIHLGNHYSSTGAVRSKGEMCEAIDARLLVDDSLKYALQVANDSGIEVLLFGEWWYDDHTCYCA
jgi:hypothetical protein